MGANVRTLVGAVITGGAVSTVTTNLDTSGPSNNAHNPPPVLQNNNSYPALQYLNCVTGDNTVTVPYGVVGVIAYPASDSNVIAWSIKSDGAATAIPQNVKGSFQTTFPAAGGLSTFIINCGSSMVMTLGWF